LAATNQNDTENVEHKKAEESRRKSSRAQLETLRSWQSIDDFRLAGTGQRGDRQEQEKVAPVEEQAKEKRDNSVASIRERIHLRRKLMQEERECEALGAQQDKKEEEEEEDKNKQDDDQDSERSSKGKKSPPVQYSRQASLPALGKSRDGESPTAGLFDTSHLGEAPVPSGSAVRQRRGKAENKALASMLRGSRASYCVGDAVELMGLPPSPPMLSRAKEALRSPVYTSSPSMLPSSSSSSSTSSGGGSHIRGWARLRKVVGNRHHSGESDPVRPGDNHAGVAAIEAKPIALSEVVREVTRAASGSGSSGTDNENFAKRREKILAKIEADGMSSWNRHAASKRARRFAPIGGQRDAILQATQSSDDDDDENSASSGGGDDDDAFLLHGSDTDSDDGSGSRGGSAVLSLPRFEALADAYSQLPDDDPLGVMAGHGDTDDGSTARGRAASIAFAMTAGERRLSSADLELVGSGGGAGDRDPLAESLEADDSDGDGDGDDEASQDWNVRYQKLIERVRSFGDDTPTEVKMKATAGLLHLASDFVHSSQTFGKIIISELYCEKKTILPVQLGGQAGGSKYIAHNLLFKFVCFFFFFLVPNDGREHCEPKLTRIFACKRQSMQMICMDQIMRRPRRQVTSSRVCRST
jgi:Clustered mitochondria